jgi:uncharacterized protein YbgA (DUF1722 family)
MIASTGEDWTVRMNAFARRRVQQLARERLSGYVLKKDSPSCGPAGVKRYLDAAGAAPPKTDGQGLFASALQRAFPDLPIEDEARLHDPRLREGFIERVFAYHRLQALWASRWSLSSLIAFHAANEMAVLAHDEPGYRRLGRLVARGRSLPRAALRDAYQAGFMAALEKPATPARHANVMMHMLGHMRDRLPLAARAELLGAIADHLRGLVPLVVPLTLIRHYVRVLHAGDLAGQTYLDPHPAELMLRNRV